MSWVLLAVSLWGALFTLNAYRPRRAPLALVPSFFAGWLTSEAPGFHLGWQAIATAGFLAAGALESWPGWLGLGVTAVSWAGLIVLIQRSRRAAFEVERALEEGLGALPPSSPAPREPWAGPLRLRHREVERVADLAYGPSGRRNLLDLYRRRDRPTGCPVLLWVHGGAWVVSQKRHQGMPLIQHLASRGWLCAAVNYRLSPTATFPDHLVDVKRAVAWLRDHAAEYGGDPGFVLVSGGSAGGHLAALAALTPNEPEYQPGFEDADTTLQACVPFYGVYDLLDRNGFRGRRHREGWLRFLERRVIKVSAADDPEAYRRASPLDRVRPDAPPFFVVHGSHDNLVPVGEARRFVEALRGVSLAPVVYLELRGAHHAFEVFSSTRTTHVVRGVERFATWAVARHRSATASELGHFDGA